MKKIIYIIVGFIGLGLGALGAVLPLMPAFPFLLLATVCFGKSSEKLDNWFKSTNLYKNNLETFVKGEGMTNKTKIRILSMITGLMAIGFLAMGEVPIGRIILVFVWIFHIVYFVRFVKTIPEQIN
ncbi:MAG: YbaN family protein [bacterium]